jgi:hypothetical protein
MNLLRNLLLQTTLSCLTVFSSLNAFEIDRVIVSTNNDPKYIQFWPLVASLWQEMGIRPTLALIADENCPIDTSIGDVIRFDPLPGIEESLQAQVIRLLLPVYFPEDHCLISDIDMLPVSRSYFVDGAAECPDEAFLVYRDNAEGYASKRYPMCYVAAKGSIFNSIFEISSPDEIAVKIHEWNEFGLGWNTDELLLYIFAQEWERKGGRIVRLGHQVGPRLDRGNWDINDNTLKNIANYVDCHCPRPYSANRVSIDLIVEAVRNQMQKQ